MRYLFFAAALLSCSKPRPSSTSAEGSSLQCTHNKEYYLTICEDKYVRCYFPSGGGIHCIPIESTQR